MGPKAPDNHASAAGCLPQPPGQVRADPPPPSLAFVENGAAQGHIAQGSSALPWATGEQIADASADVPQPWHHCHSDRPTSQVRVRSVAVTSRGLGSSPAKHCL